MPPEIERQFDEMIEDAIDDWTENRHAHEVEVDPNLPDVDC